MQSSKQINLYEGIQSMSRSSNRDEKLEQIMRLREYQKNNAGRVNAMAGIVSPADNQECGQPDREHAGASYRRYGWLRLAFSAFLFLLLCACHFKSEAADGALLQKLQAAVRTDYSDQVIDFVEDFTYTLDYEETGAR